MDSILPSSASQLERVFEQIWAERLAAIERDIVHLWDTDNCRADLLPYLAWALSVDDWNDSWPVNVKRNVIKAGIRVHRHKGTLHAVQEALKALSVTAEVVEWWQSDPPAENGTFDIVAFTNQNITEGGESAINSELIEQLQHSINNAKRFSQHYQLTTGIETNGHLTTGASLKPTYDFPASAALIRPQPIVNGGLSCASATQPNYVIPISGRLVRGHSTV
ncbi:Baseplate protein [Saliniradius amylolyticus]|uniref:Baseplate protein n=1 Tax=Saliniradius amylolyticus TaxID=2183582 RepID=A0A2S2E575_9ALTE|nr:phage tail protein I [Saliniradius amylolyticus]AWL12808.1 Baseplate protein [Saliniradius amylolyticus]